MKERESMRTEPDRMGREGEVRKITVISNQSDQESGEASNRKARG